MANLTSLGDLNFTIGVEAVKYANAMNAIEKDQKKKSKATRERAKKDAAAANPKQKDGGIFSAGWFASRARWFAQLRAFWAIWQGLANAVRGAFEFEQEMANVRAITQATNDQFEQLRQKALEVGTTTRFSSAEAAKGMVVMSQAGLSVVEILESITNVANLATATLFDFERTTSLVVTIMRAWNLTSKDSRRITDTLATAINSTKLNMAALVAGFNFVSGIAPQMNLNLQETTALLGTLANRGLSASTAATSLRAVMAALLNPTDKFKRVLKDVNLTVDDVNPQMHEFTTILKTLKDAGFGASEAFRAFRRRAAAGAAILISSAEEVYQLSNAMIENGRAAQMAAINLDTVSGQWKQFQDQMIASADVIFRDVEPAIIVVINAMKALLTTTFLLIVPMAKLFSTMAAGWRKISVMWRRGPEGLITGDAKSAAFELTSKIKDADDKIQRTINSARRLAELKNKIASEARDAVTSDDAGEETDEMKRAIKMANSAQLITFDQAKSLDKLTTMKEKQLRLEQLVGDEVARQTRLLARTFDQQKVIKEEHEKGRLAIALEATDVAWASFQVEEKKMKQRTDIIEQMRIELAILEKRKRDGEIVSKFEIKNMKDLIEGQQREKGTVGKKRLEKLDNFMQLVQANGPLTEKIILHLGEASRKFVEASTVASSADTIDQIILDLAHARSSGLSTTEKMLESLEEEVGLVAKIESKHKETHVAAIKRLKDSNTLISSRIKMLKEEDASLALIDGTLIERIAIENELATLAKLKNTNLMKIEEHGIEDTKNKIKSLMLDNQIIDATSRRVIISMKLKDVLSAINELKLDNEFKIAQMEKVNTILDLQGRQQIDILKSANNILQLRKEHLKGAIKIWEASRGIKEADDHRVAAERELALLSGDIAINTEKQLLATSAMARLAAANKADPLNFRTGKEFLNAKGGVIDTLASSAREAGGIAIEEIAGLWAEQRAEALLLEEQLKGLNEQYQAALGEGNVEKARQLEQQMGALRGRIDSLNSPLDNLANTFKKFALAVISELQKVIIKMLVVKLIGMALGMFTGGSTMQIGSGAGAYQMPQADFAAFKAGTGGVLPGGTFANFRKFARGGVTGGAGLAMLGDNPSGKELVIPSENISSNNVSGHVSDGKQPINIVNVLTEQDIAAAMASYEGQRTIINTIGKDIGKRGPTYRAIRS